MLSSSLGMLATATRTILESLDRLPNADNRTKVAIIGFDTALHFSCIPPGSADFSMLVMSDLDDVFLPKPNDLLVNLTEARAGLEALLGRFSDMFAETHSVGSALGPALQAGFKLISSMGGKLVVCTASLPTLGTGSLKNREDPKILGTTKVTTVLSAPYRVALTSRRAVRNPVCYRQLIRSIRRSPSNAQGARYPWICSFSAHRIRMLPLSVGSPVPLAVESSYPTVSFQVASLIIRRAILSSTQPLTPQDQKMQSNLRTSSAKCSPVPFVWKP